MIGGVSEKTGILFAAVEKPLQRPSQIGLRDAAIRQKQKSLKCFIRIQYGS